MMELSWQNTPEQASWLLVVKLLAQFGEVREESITAEFTHSEQGHSELHSDIFYPTLTVPLCGLVVWPAC